MEKIRVAVIGYGSMGKKYVRMLGNGEVPGMELCAVCCRNEAGRQELNRNYPGVQVFSDMDTTLQYSETFDAAVIVTPHTSHADFAERLLRAGKHVLCDKPAGISAWEARRMVETSEQTGCSLGMIFNQRMKALCQKIKEILESGQMGHLQRAVWICNSWYRTRAYHQSTPWHSTWSGEGGGLLINQCQHNLDLWQWFFGMPQSVNAEIGYGIYSDIEVDDSVELQFAYENGMRGCMISASGETPGCNRLEIWGSGGYLMADMLENRLLLKQNEVDAERFAAENTLSGAKPDCRVCEIALPPEERSMYQKLFSAYADHLLHGMPIPADGTDGLRTLQLANGAYLSSWLGKKTEFPIDEKLFETLLAQKRGL